MTTPTLWKNQLFFGDNLGILRESVVSESGERSAAQITVFEDTLHWARRPKGLSRRWWMLLHRETKPVRSPPPVGDASLPLPKSTR